MEQIKIENIVTHELNPNVMGKSDIEKLKKLINEEKNYPPLIVNKKDEGKFLLLDGHQRLNVLTDLGYKEVKCDIWDVDEKTELQLLATLNKLKGHSLNEKKKILFNELQKFLKPAQIENLIPEKKIFFDDLFKRNQDKRKVFNDIVEEKVMFVNNLTRDKYSFVMNYIKNNMTPDKAEESVYWLVQDILKKDNGNGRKI